jgi:23S rRNA pseudouridine955/2504/2580 synthase
MAAIGHPIVGDGKYGGPEAFLTGSISRKMHLHARRLLIDHPDGDMLDVVAELPSHFAASMAQLGFDETLGEALPAAPKRDPKDLSKTAAKAHAKQYRKERRGERRGRKSGERAPAGKAGARPEPPKKRGPTKGKGSPKPVPGPKPKPS